MKTFKQLNVPFNYISKKTGKETTGIKTLYIAISEKCAVYDEYKAFTNDFENLEEFKKLAISDNLLEYDNEEGRFISNTSDIKYKEVVENWDINKKRKAK